jgi:hypothetical protein
LGVDDTYFFLRDCDPAESGKEKHAQYKNSCNVPGVDGHKRTSFSGIHSRLILASTISRV